MYKSNEIDLENVNGDSMDVIAEKVAGNLERAGKDRRIVLENRKMFDENYLSQISGGSSPEVAEVNAVAAVTLSLAGF